MVAILSLHSHHDRSFLDDRELLLVSGDLRALGIANDVIVAPLESDDDVAPLVEALAHQDVVVYERIWSRAAIEALRTRLTDTIFVACRGEHELDDPPADYWCRGDLRQELPALLAHLAGDAGAPGGVFARGADGFVRIPGTPPRRAALAFEPNLHPIVMADRLRARRSFSLLGNAGCPYQADARENPLYAGVAMPDGMGRGCAFCTTGNRYDHAPAEVTAESVLEQLRFVRKSDPSRTDLVLKDQNPFAYLPELLERTLAEGLGGFRLLLETRADWFVRNRERFRRALGIASQSDVRLAPYLVGIESFSQAELDRFNKGMRAEDNIAFLDALWDWKREMGDALDLSAAAFGFVLFTPWTTLEDLRLNQAGIARTQLSRLRGKILVSRARLYPDTALYYLAQQGGLLAEDWPDARADPSRRYGYYPGHPWRFADPIVAELAATAALVTDRTGGRDQDRVFELLLEQAARGRFDADAIDVSTPSPSLERLLEPLAHAGLRVVDTRRRPKGVTLTLAIAESDPLVVHLTARDEQPAYARSTHYAVRHAGQALAPDAKAALDTLCATLTAIDGPG